MRHMGWTVLIVDDHAEFRSVARALLEAEGFAVVGEAADGASALAAAAHLRPDVVLLDVQLPDVDGFVVAERLVSRPGPNALVVLISSRPATAYRRRLADSPAHCFLSKQDLTGAALTARLAGQPGAPR